MWTEMKKLIALLLMALPVLTAQAKGDWKGKVVDENGEPIPYATVAVLSPADSTVVCGVVTQEDGTFNIVTSETDGIMMGWWPCWVTRPRISLRSMAR